jgi:hypothetical protein
MQLATNLAKRKLRIPQNLLPSERKSFRTVLNKNVGFNNSDKNFGPVLYSRNLYLEQCQKHLFDDKGTYEYTEKPRDLILKDVARRLKNLLNDCFDKDPDTRSLGRTLTKWVIDSLNRARLADFYVIWKLHKKANAQGVRSRPISNNIGYPTSQVSHFLHCQLIDAVNAHTHVLKDSLSLIRQLESLSFSPEKNVFMTSADVAALYPSINIEDGMAALQWFMREHSHIPPNLQPRFLKLARFVLENNYVACKGLDGSFLQRIGTAMGTSFSVTYATIFMIWLETPIINEFQQHIVLYKRYIDDLFLIWSGSAEELCRFRDKFGKANANIKLEWQGTPSAEDATNPAKFDQLQHRKVNFLDLDIEIVCSQTSVEFAFRVYRKPGTAYAYLPYGSYHARHIFRGWLKAEMYRLLTHSSNPTVWLEECAVFYNHLRNRGYPSKAIDSTFRSINWNQRSKMLEPKRYVMDDKFFTQYRGCVFSSRNAPGTTELRRKMDLSLKELREQGQGYNIFPPYAFFAIRSALPMGYILPR